MEHENHWTLSSPGDPSGEDSCTINERDGFSLLTFPDIPHPENLIRNVNGGDFVCHLFILIRKIKLSHLFCIDFCFQSDF